MDIKRIYTYCYFFSYYHHRVICLFTVKIWNFPKYDRSGSGDYYEVWNKVNRILDSLPDDANQPTYSKFSNDDRPVMSIGVTSNMKSVDFSTFLTNYIEPQLSKKSGVAQINLIGNADREIQVNVANQKLQAYGISNSAIATAIQNANLDYPTGSVKDQDGKYTVRLAGTIKSIEQLKKLNVPMTGRFSYRMLPMLKMVVKSGRRSVGLTVSHL